MVSYVRSGGAPFAPLGTTGGSTPSIEPFGVTRVTSAAETWVLKPPFEGARKTLFSTGVSSAARVVWLCTPTSGGQPVTVGLAASSLNAISFHSTDFMLVELLGISTASWLVTRIATGGQASLSTAITITAVTSA